MTTSSTPLDISNCIIAKGHFGHTAFHNICNGEVTTLAWTFGDWFPFGILVCLLLMLARMVHYLINN